MQSRVYLKDKETSFNQSINQSINQWKPKKIEWMKIKEIWMNEWTKTKETYQLIMNERHQLMNEWKTKGHEIKVSFRMEHDEWKNGFSILLMLIFEKYFFLFGN